MEKDRADWERADIPAEYSAVEINLEDFVITDSSKKISNLPYTQKRIGPIKLSQIAFPKGLIISPDKQKETLKILLTDDTILGTPTKVLISSAKTDKIPMLIAASIARRFLNEQRKVRFIHPYLLSEKLVFEKRPDLVCVYGIQSASTDYRIQEIRDIIAAVNWSCPVFIIAGGIPDPVEFYQKRLNLSVPLFLNIASTINI
jgi:hypothetical protein